MLKITKFLNDTDFQIVYFNENLDIINYDKINYMEDNKISLTSKEGILVISGEGLRVKKLLESEIVIAGNIQLLEFKK